MNLDHYIADLLKDHDCVVVPNFGGFVANYAPARINPVNHRFDPPHRKVSFNKLLTHNDGLLASYVARKEQEQYEAGLKLVQEYALFLRSELKARKRVKLQKVGMLSLNADGSIRFEQLENADFYSDGTGLESFFAHQVEQPEEEQKAEPAKPKVVKEQPKRPEPKVVSIQAPAVEKPTPKKQVVLEEAQQEEAKRSFPYVKLAAAAVVIPLIGYTVWLSAFTPVLKDRSNFHYSDLNPFAEKACVTYKARTAGENAEESLDYVSALEIVENDRFLSIKKTSQPDKTLVVSKREAKRVARSNSTLRYHVIGGCFGEKSNADGLANTYGRMGYSAGIVDQKGSLYRVSVASFATKKEAKQALTSLKNDLPGAWLLYK